MANAWGIPKEIEDLVILRDRKCIYCGCEFSNERSRKHSWEHIVNDINIRTLENIALCCVGCNASKGNKDLKTWLFSENAKKRGVHQGTISDVVRAALQHDLLNS